MPRSTLSFRLIASSVVWIAGSLVAAGFLLVVLFRDHIERRFDGQLYDHLEELVAASEMSLQGKLELTWIPSDPRFNRPYSGWYWQILRGNVVAGQSASVWRGHLRFAEPSPHSIAAIQQFPGPDDNTLRALVQSITLPEAESPFTFVVAGPVTDIEDDVREFTSKLVITLGVLGLGLVGAVLFQVRFGLEPLRALQKALADIRAGGRDRLPTEFPDEIQPVVRELNALLDHNDVVLERSRTQTGNLAHALRNPLTVIRNEARETTGERGETLRYQVSVLTGLVERHLSHARIAGSGSVLGARTSVEKTIEDLRFSMQRLYGNRGLDIHVGEMAGLWFQGDAQDLEEMIGNLMDNACKWACVKVVVTGKRSGGRLLITIEDDGPGIPEKRMKEVVKRGRRLDETVPGSGLGLDIVQTIAEHYQGSLGLTTSSLGGVGAQIDLPAAH